MTSPATNPAIRLMPSLTDVAFLMPLVFLFGGFGGVGKMLGDGDTGWHIRAGEWMIANGRVPDRDLFSFTRPGEPWFAWEWLWDVIFAWLHGLGGMAAVSFVSMLLISLTFALLYRLVYARCGNPVIAIGLVVLATLGSTVHWLARPHLVTSFGTVVTLMVLERARTKELSKLHVLGLILFVAMWTNLHGGWFVGVILAGAYAVGYRSMKFTLLAAGMFAASFLNPYGWQLHLHIWKYLTTPSLTSGIGEFQAPNMQLGGAGFFETMLILGVASAAWSIARNRWADAILVLGWAHLSITVVRNIPIFMIVAAPVVARSVAEWIEKRPFAGFSEWLRETGAEFAAIDRPWRTHAISVASFALIAFAMFRPEPAKAFRAEYDPSNYPVKAVADLPWLADTRVFTDDEWGDYLIYRLYPKTKVFVDGRSDFYGEKFAETYFRIMRVDFEWEKLLREQQVQAVLLPVKSPLAGVMKESSKWQVLHDDGISIVFRLAGAGPPAASSNAESAIKTMHGGASDRKGGQKRT